MGGTMDLHPLTVIAAMLVGGTLGASGGCWSPFPRGGALKLG